ncbi:MAG: efflux RND transporter periplasmic adaptor subunit [Hyphomonadaceae bacterium]
MNRPERPQFFTKAEGLFKRVADAGGNALRNARSAGETAFEGGDDPAKRRKVLLMLGGGIVAVIAILALLSRLGGDGATHTAVDTRQAVSVIQLEARTFQPIVALNGEARPQRDIQVTAPATGVRILEILVDEGDTVRAGQPMARLDTALSQAQTRAAQASVAEAQSAAIRARDEYQRAESIRDSGALSTEAIEQRRAAAAAADARLAAARAQLAEVNARLGGGYVRAPAAGLVIDRSAEIGRSVDGQVLFRIAAGNDLEVAAQVAEADMLALEEGQTATFSLVDGSTVEATLRRLPASIDSRTRTGEALFALPRDTQVRAGMYLRGAATLAPRDQLAAPQSSVLYEGGDAYVFVIGEDNVVARTPVTLGVRDGDWIAVTGGVQPGQRIAGAGAAFLRDGEQIRLIQDQPAAAVESSADDLRGRKG